MLLYYTEYTHTYWSGMIPYVIANGTDFPKDGSEIMFLKGESGILFNIIHDEKGTILGTVVFNVVFNKTFLPENDIFCCHGFM